MTQRVPIGPILQRYRVRKAIAAMTALPGSGPNRFSAPVEHGWLSAPTKRELCLMIWHWFAPDPVA